jgi:putative membrane protein
MQDEAPDGPPKVGSAAPGADADGDAPESTWWPFGQPEPGTEVESDATAGAQAAPEADPTLSFPVDAGPVTEPEPEPRPDPVVEQEQSVPVDITAAAPGEPTALAELDPDRFHDVEAEDKVAIRSGVATVFAASAGSGDPEPVAAERREMAVEMPADAVPKEGTDKAGNIPSVSARRAWARRQWYNWRLYLVRFVSAGLAVIAAVALVPGLTFTSWQWGQGLEIALIFALLNAFVKPVLQFLSLRFLFSTFGIVVVLINSLLLYLLSVLMDNIQIDGLLSIILGGVLVGVVGAGVDAMLGADYPMLDRDYKERNGLA